MSLEQLDESPLEQPLSAPELLESLHDPPSPQPLSAQLGEASHAESAQPTEVLRGGVVEDVGAGPNALARQLSSGPAHSGRSRKSEFFWIDEIESLACASNGHDGALLVVHDETESIASAKLMHTSE